MISEPLFSYIESFPKKQRLRGMKGMSAKCIREQLIGACYADLPRSRDSPLKDDWLVEFSDKAGVRSPSSIQTPHFKSIFLQDQRTQRGCWFDHGSHMEQAYKVSKPLPIARNENSNVY